MTIHLTTITFPEIALTTRDAHKLRGYFGNVFREHSPLLHNHYENGELRYRYPLVQYKVLNKVPTLVAMEEGAGLITKLFLKIQQIDIDGRKYPVYNKNIAARKCDIGLSEDLHRYTFSTRWMALNQENYAAYQNGSPQERQALLKRILVGNILSFFKNMGLMLNPEQRVMVLPDVQAHETMFKNQGMLAFEGEFAANVLLPDGIGLGKSVSRGFGCIQRCQQTF